MPIHHPGTKFRHSKILSKRKGKRELVALLSLTAMVDMFTVLVIFLLQNYNATGQVIYIPKDVTLPKAEKIKELMPAIVVTISNKEILIDKNPVITFQALSAQQEWMVVPLFTQMVEALKKAREEYEFKLQNQIQKAVVNARGEKGQEQTPWNKVTIQADKGMDFLSVKKIMYTVTEAGAGEINFAVTKQTNSE
jgi:biopolymer transport protein ExbD